MGKSRARHIRWFTPRADPLAVAYMFKEAAVGPLRATPPPVLYHYTNWSAAEGILRSKEFWATAHNSTNDDAELQSADQIIMEVAGRLRSGARGSMVTVLELFLEEYSEAAVAKIMTVYLASFSAARDAREQWLKYADEGRGICLGLRVVTEKVPTSPHLGSGLLKVDYSEASWRTTIDEHFRKVASLIDEVKLKRIDLHMPLSALFQIAGFLSMSAKAEKWAPEREYRHVTILHPDARLKPRERVSDGKAILYLPVVLRAPGKRIALAEVIIGPNQNVEEASLRITKLLAEASYKVGDIEYPEITVSSIRL